MTTMTQKPLGSLTKWEAYEEAQALGARFLANVIFETHRRPFAKLVGLVSLLRAGHTVALLAYRIDALVIDGKNEPWSKLTEEAEAA